ncbi:MAG: protein-L-isoaspartate(D-aspartate) O-methyltransferase [Chloroflexi bacterium]|nr:protein-L-isoaspartate(D-aspartate) O-methyltransferase [Chloroflexota bacterium]
MDLDSQKHRLLAHLRREIDDEDVLAAMERVPRELFVPETSRHLAYEDIPLPTSEGQTISQPLIVALMTAALRLKKTDKVLEMGTGSGYQAAILCLLAGQVISVERLPPLARAAQSLLHSLGYTNVSVRLAGQALGCPEEAPFDAIVVTAGAPWLPRVLLDQLTDDGRLVIPVGSRIEQDLLLVNKTREGYSVKGLGPCRFVPLLGPGAWEDDESGPGKNEVPP